MTGRQIIMSKVIKKSQTNQHIHPQPHHERSLDNFLKQIKKYNLKSDRPHNFLSPKPFSMYQRKNYQLHPNTLDRSRTLSGKHSNSKKTNKTLRKNIQKILNRSSSLAKRPPSVSPRKKQFDNPGEKIEKFTMKIREVEKAVEGRSRIGSILCSKFLEMLNEIVEDMILNLQVNLQELETNISTRLERELSEKSEKEIGRLKKMVRKLQRKTMEVLQKQNYNSNLIYHLRLQSLDVDREFGRCVFGSDDFGGRGYHRDQLSQSSLIEFKLQKPVKKEPNDQQILPPIPSKEQLGRNSAHNQQGILKKPPPFDKLDEMDLGEESSMQAHTEQYQIGGGKERERGRNRKKEK